MNDWQPRDERRAARTLGYIVLIVLAFAFAIVFGIIIAGAIWLLT